MKHGQSRFHLSIRVWITRPVNRFAFGESPLVVTEPSNSPLFHSSCNSVNTAAGAMASLLFATL